MSKLTKHEKEELKSLVINARIRRLTAKETGALILEKLGVSITIDYVRRLSMELKRDCVKELSLLQNCSECSLIE